jgi:hypothetical protein
MILVYQTCGVDEDVVYDETMFSGHVPLQLTAVHATTSSTTPHAPHLGLQWHPQRLKATSAVIFLNFAGREESRMIHKLRTPEIPVTPSLVFTMRLGVHTSRYGPAKQQMKRRHTLRFHAGKGEACPFPISLSPPATGPCLINRLS